MCLPSILHPCQWRCCFLPLLQRQRHLGKLQHPLSSSPPRGWVDGWAELEVYELALNDLEAAAGFVASAADASAADAFERPLPALHQMSAHMLAPAPTLLLVLVHAARHLAASVE